MRVALSIAGSDSGGGAGIQADLKTFAAFGVYGTTAVTAITAQNTCGITSCTPVPPAVVQAQIRAVASDFPLHATKTGMLVDRATVETVAAAVAELQLPLLVVDPVIVATSGHRLLDENALDALRAALIPRAFVVTPNIPEAAALTRRVLDSRDAVRLAARDIVGMGAGAVIITGGHDDGEDVVDLLYDGRTFCESRTERLHVSTTHGTGCTFASAVAASLALGRSLPESASTAQRYVAGAIRYGVRIGRGHGPVQQFWQQTGGILSA